MYLIWFGKTKLEPNREIKSFSVRSLGYHWGMKSGSKGKTKPLEVVFRKNNLTATMKNADNFDWCQTESIDLILTDPPFNIARDTNFHTYEKNTINSYRFDKGKGWDSYTPEDFRKQLKDWALNFYRVLRPGGSFAIFCADEYLSDLIWSLREAGLKPRRTITWRKPNAVPVNRAHMMMSACEYIVYGVKKSNAVFNSDIEKQNSEKLTPIEVTFLSDKVGSIVSNRVQKALEGLPREEASQNIEQAIAQVLRESITDAQARIRKIYGNHEVISLAIPNFVTFNSKVGKRIHPTEKPTDLLGYLVCLLSNEGDLILDPFAGSGSTAEAALACGRNVLLVEKDDEFFAKSVERIRGVASQSGEGLF